MPDRSQPHDDARFDLPLAEQVAAIPKVGVQWNCPHDGRRFGLLFALAHMDLFHPECDSCKVEGMILSVILDSKLP